MNYAVSIYCEKESAKGTHFRVLLSDKRIKDKLRKLGDVMLGELRIDDGRHITAQQRKAIYATINDIASYSGDVPEMIKELLKYRYIGETGEGYFSLANCSVTVARDFLTFVLDFCLEWGIPLSERAVERTDDIDAYLWSCIKYKKCAVCGADGEIHHVDTIGMGNDRKTLDDSDKRKICLCRKHHAEIHQIGTSRFESKYKVKGVIYCETR